MLPRNHRLTRPSEISAVVSRGHKKANQLVVVYVDISAGLDDQEDAARAAVIVGKAIGGAPARNRVKRRIRHVLAELIGDQTLEGKTRCVVRALAGSAEASWADIHNAVTTAVSEAVRNA